MTLFDALDTEGEAPAKTDENETRAAPSGPLSRVVLALAYDGTAFHGFARQPGRRTVAGELASALAKMVGHEVALTCAGRTDAGVHAQSQVVHADLASEVLERRYRHDVAVPDELAALRRGLNRQLAGEIVVWHAAFAAPDFDARRSATARRYAYLIGTTERPDPVRRFGTWQLGEPLDLAVMRLAADPLIGSHDFSAFCKRPPGHPAGPITRRVVDARWRILADGRYCFEIEAQSFCQQMVRSIVGMLVAVGRGQRRPSDIVAHLRSGSREQMATVAPACGLYLTAVGYPDALGGRFE